MLLLPARAASVKRPELLDLYCKAGGASRGYYDAGFNVRGVDIEPQPNYPYPFIQADALDYLAEHGWRYDAIHASPPCQKHSSLKRLHDHDAYDAKHVDLIPHTRFLLTLLGKPYVIENVAGAPLRNPVMLCGTQFGLKVYRHRIFESNILLLAPNHVPHKDKTPSAGRGLSPKGFVSVSGTGGLTKGSYEHVTTDWWAYLQDAMGIDWMARAELSQAVPPAFTHWIGRQLMYAVTAAEQKPITDMQDAVRRHVDLLAQAA